MSKDSDRVVHVETSKNEDTWYRALSHYDAEYDTTLKVFDGWWLGRYSVQNRNADGNLYVRYLYWNDEQWVSNYNWLDNDWNVNNPSAQLAILFISLPILWESFVS